MPRLGRFAVLAVLLVVSLHIANCADSDSHAVAGERRDSSGVALVHYPVLPTGDSTVNIDREARVVIGAQGQSTDYELFDVVGVARLSDGRVVIANSGSNELRWFGSDGTFLFSVGREGAGPGEFRMITWLGHGPGDSVVTADGALGRIQVFDPEGHFARAVSLGDGMVNGFSRPIPAGVLADGSIVAVLSSLPVPGAGGPQRDPQLIGRLRPGAEIWDSLQVIPGPEQLVAANTRGGVTMTAFVFGAYPDLGVGPSRVAAVETNSFGFELFSPEWALQTRVSIDGPSVPVTDALVSSYVDASLELWPPGASAAGRSAFRRRVTESPHASVLPRVRSVEVDRVGRVWLELYPLPGTSKIEFAVFEPNGKWIGRLVMPAGLDRGTHPATAPGLEIGEDYVLGVWRDPNGVESVRMYDLHIRGGG